MGHSKSSRRGWFAALALALPPAAGCGADAGSVGEFTAGLSGTGTDSGQSSTGSSTADTTASSGTGGASSGSATGGSGTGEETDSGFKFDVGGTDGAATAGDGGGPAAGCEKVDFLFVFDGSPSMLDERKALVASTPGFLDAIEQATGAEDFHLMVVDTAPRGSLTVDAGCTSKCSCEEQCNRTRGWMYDCTDNTIAGSPTVECWPFHQDAVACDGQAGAGRRFENWPSWPCGPMSGGRWMRRTDPDLASNLACLAELSSGLKEVALANMMRSVSPDMVDAGGCNEGFVRDDAILFVTMITDEDDDEAPDPQVWWDAMVAAKNGNPDAVTLLAITNPSYEAFFAPYLGLANALTGSTQNPDFDVIFGDALPVVKEACDNFVPPG